MEVTETNIEGVLLIKPKVYKDERGFFCETYSKKIYSDKGIKEEFVQDNYSHSRKDTLRGLHYQLKNPQGKLVRVLNGSVLDVVVDIRKSSKTFSHYFSVELDDISFYQLYMPPGIAHGFCVISEKADFEYKCTEYYYPEDQFGIAWNDPIIDIRWPTSNPSLSKKDKEYSNINQVALTDLPD